MGIYKLNSKQLVFSLMVILAVFYNAILAFINGNVAVISIIHPVLSEILIIGVSVFLLMDAGFKSHDRFVLIYISLFSFISIYLSLLNGYVFVDGLRNFLIMSVFFYGGEKA